MDTIVYVSGRRSVLSVAWKILRGPYHNLCHAFGYLPHMDVHAIPAITFTCKHQHSGANTTIRI